MDYNEFHEDIGQEILYLLDVELPNLINRILCLSKIGTDEEFQKSYIDDIKNVIANIDN